MTSMDREGLPSNRASTWCWMKCLPGSHWYVSVADKAPAGFNAVSRTSPVVFQVPMNTAKSLMGFFGMALFPREGAALWRARLIHQR